MRCGDFASRVVSDNERIGVFYSHTIAPATIADLLPTITLAVLWHFSSAMTSISLTHHQTRYVMCC